MEIFLFVVKMSFIFASNNRQYADFWKKLLLSFFFLFSCVRAHQYPDVLLQHLHRRFLRSLLGGLRVCFTKHAHWPCTLAPVTLFPLRLALSLLTWPNCSCKDSSHITHWVQLFCVLLLSIFSLSLSLSPGSWHWGLGGGPRGRCFVFTVCWMTLTELWLRTGGGAVDVKRGIGRERGVTHQAKASGLGGGYMGGGGGTHLPASALLSFHYQHLISFFYTPHPPPSPKAAADCAFQCMAVSVCQRRDASELPIYRK